jgi:hypothetical protein
MPDHLRIVLPTELADQLVSDGIAVRPMGTRGALLSEPVSLAIEAVNTGSAMISIAVGLATCKRLAEIILERRRPSEPDQLTIDITVAGESRSLSLDRHAADAQDEILDFLVDALDAG